MPQLTTTSYAILGQLALGDASTYELAKRIGRNMRYFWPRAESRIYAEAKRLVESGLVEAAESYVGKRRRTTYSITAEGRQALASWLASPASDWFSLETEGLLRLFLADSGTKEDIVAAVEGIRDEAIEMLLVGRSLGEAFLAGRHPNQDLVHIRALVFDFLAEIGLGVVDWADRTLAEVENWDGGTQERQAKRALRVIEEHLVHYPTPDDRSRSTG